MTRDRRPGRATSASAVKSSFDANLTSTRAFVGIRVPPPESRITVFPGGNIKISNVLKISPRLHAVPLGLRCQGIGSSVNFSVFFIKAEWLGLGPKSYRRIFAGQTSMSS